MSERINLQLSEMPASKPLIIDAEKCTGCNSCVEICMVDLFVPNSFSGKPPVILYPGECWYCGCCVMVCPEEGAITLRHPLMNQVNWIEKGKLLK